MTNRLTAEQIKAIETELQALKQRLQDMLAGNVDATQTVELDQTRQGRLSRMDAMQGQAMAKAAQVRSKAQLEAVERKLRQIDEPDFGDCEECGEPIAVARLLGNPAASLCISCAQALENNSTR